MAELTGIVSSIIFRNEQNGYTVLEMLCGREEFTAVGVMPFLAEGERATLQGEWAEHPTFGPQLKVTGYESTPPSELIEIERYLGSGLIRGIGPSTATAIVEAFGKEALDIMHMYPERLREVPGIGPKRAEQIAESFAQQQGMRSAMLFLQRYEISAAFATRIYRKYEGATERIIKENPYRLVADIQGIGFKTADRIAARLGVAGDSEFRLRAGLQYALQDAAASQGHIFLPRGELIARAQELLGSTQELISHALEALAIAREAVLREEDGDVLCYLPHAFAAEGEVATRLYQLRSGAKGGGYSSEAVTAFEKREDIEFSPTQRDAVRLALENGVSVITGGPGTGKTTIINCIITLLEQAGQKTLLCAPTGRAAKRMAEATGREAKTIHRLLEYAPGGEEYAFQKNQDDPLKCGALVVDEMSMVDLFLMRSLLRAVKTGTLLILVGDVDQLPSVGAGNVLGDVIDSGMLPVVRLTEIFRQAAASMIVQNAHRINRGEMPVLDAREGDFFFDRKNSLSAAAGTAIDLVVRRLPGYLGVDPRSIQVLCPMKKGECGVHRLNQMLQQALNPPQERKRERTLGEQVLREGDRVMQTRNNYQLTWEAASGGEEGEGVFNGDIGVIENIDPREREITVLFDDGRRVVYDDASAIEIELCYAMSIHKSQGSEFAAVVIPIVSGPPMLLTRNLLYTALTRARRLAVLVGSESAIYGMVSNNRILQRFTRLAARMKALEALGGS